MSAGRLIASVAAGLVVLGCGVGPASAAAPRTTNLAPVSSRTTNVERGWPGTTTPSTAGRLAVARAAAATAAPSGDASATGMPTGRASGAATPSGAPVPSGAPTPGRTPTPTGSATPAPTSSAAPTPTASPGTLRPVNVGGVLFVSGVTTTLRPSWDPLGGTLHVEMTVRNATDQVIDASASVGATTLLGVDLGASDSIAVRGLAPGEIRTIGADIGGVGQWGVLKAHMTLTPPAQLRGVELAPLARERWVLAPPWYAIGLLVALAVIVWVFRHYRLGLVPRRLRNGRTRPWEPGSPSFPVVIP